MVSTYTYNSEGQLTGLTYPSSWDGSTWSPGPSRSVQYDLMGRPKKLINAATSADVVSTTTYGVMGQILTMNGPGMDSETREYNSIGQMTRLVAGWQDVHYNYPSTGNNGKVASEDRKWSSEPTETVTYTYDSLNRLASAVSSDNPGWGQSFGYDGFGNLTNVSVTKGSAPSLSVSYSASTNRRTSDCADANGNISPCGQTYTWDVSNRLTSVPISGGTMRYSYDTANRRIWRGSSSVDELTYYAASGSKMAVYNLSTSGSDLRATSTETHEYFNGRKLGGAADRLGSYGRYYPYGQDRYANPSNPSNGTEKFGTYKRDSETGLDYAVNRYHAPGDGRFLSPDPYQASAGPGDPGSWNRYAYTRGDPVNRLDPQGTCDIMAFGLDGDFIYGLAAQGFTTEQVCWLYTRASELFTEVSNLSMADLPSIGGGFATQGTTVGPLTFNNPNNTGPYQATIESRLNFISNNIDSGCATWLFSNTKVSAQWSSVSQMISELITNSLVGYATVTAQQGVNNASTGSAVGGFSIIVNIGGSVINKYAPRAHGKAYDSQVNAINPASERSGVFTMLHELAHYAEVPGFRDDTGQQGNVDLNNDDIWKNCSATLRKAKN